MSGETTTQRGSVGAEKVDHNDSDDEADPLGHLTKEQVEDLVKVIIHELEHSKFCCCLGWFCATSLMQTRGDAP